MNIWMVLLTIAAVALLVGPVAMMQPSPRQRRLEKLRLGARELGLNMRLEKLHAVKNINKSVEVLPHYILPARKQQPWQLLRSTYEHESHVAGWWEYLDEKRPAEDVLEKLAVMLEALPNTVKSVTCTTEGFGFFWTEQGDLDDLTQLFDLLKTLKTE